MTKIDRGSESADLPFGGLCIEAVPLQRTSSELDPEVRRPLQTPQLTPRQTLATMLLGGL